MYVDAIIPRAQMKTYEFVRLSINTMKKGFGTKSPEALIYKDFLVPEVGVEPTRFPVRF